MKLSELLNIIGTADRIRIIDGHPGNKEVQFDKDLTVLYITQDRRMSFWKILKSVA